MLAYVAWVNVQLKKKEGTRPIEDLPADMHDGVSLVHLINIVGMCLIYDKMFAHL